MTSKKKNIHGRGRPIDIIGVISVVYVFRVPITDVTTGSRVVLKTVTESPPFAVSKFLL